MVWIVIVAGAVFCFLAIAHIRREARGQFPPMMSPPPRREVRVIWEEQPEPVVVRRTLPPTRVEVGEVEALPIERRGIES